MEDKMTRRKRVYISTLIGVTIVLMMLGTSVAYEQGKQNNNAEAMYYGYLQLTLEPQSATNYVGTSHTLTATLTDWYGVGMSDQIITFIITGPHAGKSGTGITDANGVATFSYTGTVAGTDTIVASGYELTSNSVEKIWQLPNKLTLGPKSATNYIGQSHRLTATLTDGSGSPISGQGITFTITAGPHAGKSGSGTTDKSGVATWSYVGTKTGTDTIIAAGYDLTSSSVKKTWQEDLLSISLTPATAKNPAGTDHKITATVKNSTGGIQSGVTVSFSIISGPNSPLKYSGVTNSKGQVAFTYTGDGGLGIDSIQAAITVNKKIVLSNVVKKEWIASGDILAYYRGLGQNPSIVETSDLLKAADDWRSNVVPPGFYVSLTTSQLLILADEWRVS